MKITWIGHACFKIESQGAALITDPYEDGYIPGLKPLRDSAEIVLCSHGHGDHNAASLITLTGKEAPFKISLIDSYHDEVKGAKRGPNKITIIEAEGLKVVHFGDIGCVLEPDQIECLKDIDVAMIPVGGTFTLDNNEAAQLVKQLAPKKVIPMHYQAGEKFGFPVLQTVDGFAAQFDSVMLSDCSIDNALLPEAQVIVLQPRDMK